MVSPGFDRLAVVTFSGIQKDTLFLQLAREHFGFTVVDSRGEMFQEPDVYILVGFHSDRLQALLDVVRRSCHSYHQFVSTQSVMRPEMPLPLEVEAKMGGASFYLMNVERFEQI